MGRKESNQPTTKSCRPKAGLKYVRLLHDNAPAPYSPDLAPCDYFLFPKLKYHLSGRRYNSRNALGSAVYQCLMGVPIEEYEKCFQKLIDQLFWLAESILKGRAN